MGRQEVTESLVVVLTHVVAAAGCWLRLRWRLRHERARARMLVEIVTALAVTRTEKQRDAHG
ncbi:hypothetical protein [Paractinoplanes durhamensis]|uniref:Uncharacterized protein n=1 Tax=Paractinoplanes durhamensis TaxID=113563 RepID=A0ABQ3YTF4_9ACTN|nr:hypothetical protein [Actinoplanes durhamensis]GIE00866.1 hypothetical protein Adu01nite_22160 [Actinoplanes durhamensis]